MNPQLHIYLAPNFLTEKQYVLDFLLHDLLGYTLVYHLEEGSKMYKIKGASGVIQIQDVLFASCSAEGEDYLSKKFLPPDAKKDHDATCDQAYVVLYGDVGIRKDGANYLINFDLVGATFFMLSRFEELLVDAVDIHGRFKSSASYAVKHNFLHRPIVNEYVELLKHYLSIVHSHAPDKKRAFSVCNTHDVDHVYWIHNRWDRVKKQIRALSETSNKKKKAQVSYWLKQYDSQKHNPFQTFDHLMDVSDTYDIKSHFNFCIGQQDERLDPKYNIEDAHVQAVLSNIKNRGHSIGFHPSYGAAEDADLFNRELAQLQTACGLEIRNGRNHYLRLKVPNGWQLWDMADMEWESSLCFADALGFRAGICDAFPIFDLEARNVLKLQERPLSIMDASLRWYMNFSPEDAWTASTELIDTIKKYNGVFVFLWHNSSFNLADWYDYGYLYEAILNYCYE